MERSKKIIATSVIGIIANLLLVVFKAGVGFITGSVAVLLDAVNNLSDALSSVITIIGTKLSNKAPDKKHPYGHGRIEYLTSVLISVIVLAAGALSAKESIVKIIKPETATYSIISVIIIVVAIAVKLGMGFYVKGVGKKLNSGALTASGTDAVSDAALSSGTLVAALVSMIWGVSIEGWIGALISVFIIKAGIEMLIDTLNSIIGVRADRELTERIKQKICEYNDVFGCYDLTLHNYGPTQIIGSAHIEVPDEMTAKQIHKLTRTITADIYGEFGIILSIGIYASNESNNGAEIKEKLSKIVSEYSGVLQLHGFYYDEEQKSVTFDIVLDFEADAAETLSGIVSKIKECYPDITFYPVLDKDYSD